MAKWRKSVRRAGGWLKKGLSMTPIGGAIDMFRGLKGGGSDDEGGVLQGAVERDVTRSGGDAAINFRSKTY